MKYEYLIFFWQFLFSQEDVLKGSVSIEHLIEMLQLFPFSLEESEAQLLSRYLVEDSDSKYTTCNFWEC
jgi:hypothetical protein